MTSLTRNSALRHPHARPSAAHVTLTPSCKQSAVPSHQSVRTTACCWPACKLWPGACPRLLAAPTVRCRSHAEVGQSTRNMAAYQVLLTMVAKLHTLETAAAGNIQQQQQQQQQRHGDSLLDKFIAARPEVISIPFISWLADKEADAQPGEMKQKLGGLCERLVMARESLEQERFDQLHADTLTALGASDAGQDPNTRIAAQAAISYSGAPVLQQQRLPQQRPQAALTSAGGCQSDLDAAAAAAAMAPTPLAPASGSAGLDGRERHEAVLMRDGQHGQPRSSWQGSGGGAQEPGFDMAALPSDMTQPAISSSNNSGISSNSSVGSSSSSSSDSLAVLSDPVEYALRLSEVVTGRPVSLMGYGSLMDAVIAAAPPVALSPEGLALAHKQAEELRLDLAARRKGSVASILGRVKVTPEQAAQLMAGSAPARILDLLLSLPSTEERIALLPDCFTPPDESDTQANNTTAAAQPEGENVNSQADHPAWDQPTSGSESAAGFGDPAGVWGQATSPRRPQQGRADSAQGRVENQQGSENSTNDVIGTQGDAEASEEETDALWCTPSQLLNEINGRLSALSSSDGVRGPQVGEGVSEGPRQLGPVDGQVVGPELRVALEQLREKVNDMWLDGLGQNTKP